MPFVLTAKKKAELRELSREIGMSYEALVESEEISYLLKTGGIEALEAAGYHVNHGTHPHDRNTALKPHSSPADKPLERPECMAPKRNRPRVQVELTAYWGNDDAESTITVSRRRWAEIQNGQAYATGAWGWYEGRRFRVRWTFAGGLVSIDESDGNQHWCEEPVSGLIARMLESDGPANG